MLHRLAAAVGGKADAREDLRDPLGRLPGCHAVEARRVGEVLLRRHLLEEARLDRDAVDEPANRPRLRERVVSEHARAAAIVQEQRRKQPDQRRLPGTVLAEDRHALAALDAEAHVLQRRPATLTGEAAAVGAATAELLAQAPHVDCRYAGRTTGAGWCCLDHCCSLERGGERERQARAEAADGPSVRPACEPSRRRSGATWPRNDTPPRRIRQISGPPPHVPAGKSRCSAARCGAHSRRSTPAKRRYAPSASRIASTNPAARRGAKPSSHQTPSTATRPSARSIRGSIRPTKRSP